MLVANLEDPGRLADLIASNLELAIPDAQRVLETIDGTERLKMVSEFMLREIQLLTMQQEISSQARGEIDRNQREYFLRQQLRAIQLELGEENELAEEVARYRKLAEEKQLPEEAKEELERQIRRLERGHPDSAEAAVQRTYLDWLTGLPWQAMSIDNLDLEHARTILDEDHWDLEKIKERMLEFLAVRKLKANARGPILCFVGPPGVGKTSLGRSIARAMGRKFVRLSLGGVRDEAEIRGHRRTYVGALPGRILQGLHQAGTGNPVFMLDEIDKIGADFRGDPSSALLEVLDPEQNSNFRDHYLGVAYDLSRVLFVTTANLLEPIQPAFLDRMEVLRLSGYTVEEKLAIAKRHLLPKTLADNGLSDAHLAWSDAALRRTISGYTREAGLRGLEREMASVCRKVAITVAGGKARRVTIGPRTIEKYLGQPKHTSEDLLERDRIGVATGLAWTAAGGELMFIEVLATPGQGAARPHGPAGRRDEGVRPGRALLHPRLGGAQRPPRRVLHPERPACARSGGRHSQGRPFGRHHHRFGAGVDAHRQEDRPQAGDDRRDHPARRGHGDRRPQRETSRRAGGRHPLGRVAEAQQTRLDRDSGFGPQGPHAPHRRLDG